MRRAGRGATYGTVLMILAVAVLLVFSLANLSTFQLNLSQSHQRQDHARNLAESCIHMAIGKLAANDNFGKAGETVRAPNADYPEDYSGVLTFSSGVSLLEGVGQSTYNLDQNSARSGTGRSVPAGTVHLIGLGKAGDDVQVQVECLYYRPAFPVGLSCGGEIHANGLLLTGLVEGTNYPGSLSALDAEDLRPADLFSNATSSQAVVLGTGCEISGDVGAVGGINLDPSAQVRGEVAPGSPPTTIPDYDIPAVRNQMQANNIVPVPMQVSGSVHTVDWYTETGSLTIYGDLSMDGGLLYVAGDLTVTGKVSGRGAVLAEGDIHLGQSSDFQSRDQIALAAGGNLTMQRGSGSGHFFKGLVYADGQLDVSDLTVVGTVVSHGNSTLENVEMIQTNASVSIRFGRPAVTRNNDDALFWRINPVIDPATGGLLYDYTLALYYHNGKPSNDMGQYLVNSWKGQGLTRQAVIDTMVGVADSDYQAEQAQGVRPSQLLAAELPGYINSISQPTSGSYSLQFDLNQLLTPVQRPRILLWRRM